MPAATYQATGSWIGSASAVTLTPAKPSTATGDTVGVLIAVVGVYSNAVVSTATAGWTKISQTNSGAGYSQAIFIASPQAANPVMTWTGAASCHARVFHISDANNPMENTLVGARTSATGTSATITATTINTTRDDSVVIVITGTALGGNSGNSPSGWDQMFRDNTSTPSRSATGSIAYVPTSGSSAPAFSISSPNAAWVADEIELLFKIPDTALSASSAELVRLQHPAPGVSASSTEVAMVESHGSGMSAASVEITAPISSGYGVGVAAAEVCLILRPAPPRKHYRLNIN